jgi:glycosyltransferase involved in cell wall biosynthesis
MSRKKLNLAILGSATLPIPPFNGYGGTQRGIYDLISHLNGKGHEIHLFGPGDSDVKNLENIILHAPVKNSIWIPENKLPVEIKTKEEKRHYEESIDLLKKIDLEKKLDVINIRTDNSETIKKVVENFGKERIIYSLHNVKNLERVELIKELGVQCITHCRNHRKEYKDLQNISTIIYGVNVENYPYSGKTLMQAEEKPKLDILKKLKKLKKDYLINIGGIGKHKGQKTCIRLALETNNNLIIAGEPQDRKKNDNGRYFQENVIPKVDNNQIFYFGNANEEEKKELLRYSKGFLFPSGFEDTTWSEPFGRAPVEALSCGTPVIAFRKGSTSEIIFNGFNGYLFDSIEEAKEKINSLDNISRNDCRRTAFKKFNSKRVADEYEKIFYETIKK